MLDISDARPEPLDDKRLRPVIAHGLQAMSIGLLVDEAAPAVWRGPMATSALSQLLHQTAWNDLDLLVVDMPPGTGDIQLTLAQRVPVAGALVVTTPQDVALADARKGLEMFRKVSVPVLGVVENMSLYRCRGCGETVSLFGQGGGARLAERCEVALLGELPLDPAVGAGVDAGPAHDGRGPARRGRATVSPDRHQCRAGTRARPPGLQFGHAEHRCGAHLNMSIKSDRWIRRMATEHGMIEPFEPGQVRTSDGRRLVSYGTSSYGYDVRCSREFKVFTNINSAVVDPKAFDESSFVDMEADACIIPPNSFALARTVEYFRIPRNVLTICLGKSTYARCGIIVNVTPLEPEWEGQVTLEFSNTTPLPARIYANEGVAQMLFFESDEPCETSYKDRGGKYQGQTGVTVPRT